ncbi:enoyl-CoA hydratase/isomerase family protein [Cryptosporangium phraense]|uniref:Enoyl-CoA hydratase/isomerase family protein n=1 Tax=Cryptosporangium phraense TaxID=2593070 RepID=A0A545AIS7_9ACTN|nr:enoyl-CoA hydratase/isomerase family protein [Cryptosporangium phraense]TQS41226.1 enoyl-CoA hydratase/isomerase family protein [Cryptosporangium phraense]
MSEVLTLRIASTQTFDALTQLGRELTGDVRVLVLHVADWPTDPATLTDETIAGYQQAVSRLQRPDLVLVTTAADPLTGLAAELALCGDLRFFAPDASVALTAVHEGRVPILGTTARLADLVGPARALELCLTGRPVQADEAERLGLATPGAVEPSVDLLTGTDRNALTEIKALMAGARYRTPTEHATEERHAFLRLASPDS